MKTVITERANAKINLSLYVGKIRQDGYHDISTVMACVSFGDVIELTKSEKMSLTASRRMPEGEDNIAFRAMQCFYEYTKIPEAASIKLKKQIPVGAGLGGGSADAAAVLRALNRMYSGVVPEKQLYELALSLGADVPFCLYGKPAYAAGVGEKLEPVHLKKQLNIIIAAGAESASTKKMFALLDQNHNTRPDGSCDSVINALETGNLPMLCSEMRNDFELCYNDKPWFVAMKKNILDSGARGCMLTGSGSALFGIYDCAADTAKALITLRNKGIYCYRCTTVE